MRSRTLLALLLAGPLLLGTTACGDDETASDDTTELESDGERSSNDTKDDAAKDDSSGDDSSTDSLLDDIDALNEMPGFENLGDCMSIGLTYATLGLSVLGGDDAAKEAIGQLEDIGSKLPDELKDDLKVVADAYAKVAEEGLMSGGEALDSDEFNKADKNITDYLDEHCNPGN